MHRPHLQADEEHQGAAQDEEGECAEEAKHAELLGQLIGEAEVEDVGEACSRDQAAQSVQVGHAQHAIGLNDGQGEEDGRKVLAKGQLSLPTDATQQASDCRLAMLLDRPAARPGTQESSDGEGKLHRRSCTNTIASQAGRPGLQRIIN